MIALILLATFIASIFFLIRICFKSYSDNNTNGNISSNKSKKNTFSHSISKLPPQVKSIKEKFGLGGSGTSVITISISKVLKNLFHVYDFITIIIKEI